MDAKTFQVGVNLGGWVSQFPAYDYNHFDTFIQSEDIRRIADWGCDHIRLPVDYPVLEEENRAGVVNERGMDYIRRGLAWCHENALKVILDLHKAPGFSFNNFQAATLFDRTEEQDRFLNLWETLANSLQDTKDFVAFELLNEIVLPESSPWNRLASRTIDCIRKVDRDRLIILGGNYYNAASQLANLDVLNEANILYTFHFYEPMVVTHQKASWVKGLLDYNQKVSYPGIAPDLAEFLERNPEHRASLGGYTDRYLDKSTLRADLQPALDFAHATEKKVYCGEYGVIEAAPVETRLNWANDLISILRENNIGRAYWSYKGVDFGLVDPAGEIVCDELVKIVCSH